MKKKPLTREDFWRLYEAITRANEALDELTGPTGDYYLLGIGHYLPVRWVDRICKAKRMFYPLIADMHDAVVGWTDEDSDRLFRENERYRGRRGGAT